MGGAEFGEAVGEDVPLAEYARQPQRHRAGDLDLHEEGVFIEQLDAVRCAFKTRVAVAGGDIAVEGDAQVGVIPACPRDAAVADKGFGREAVALHHIVDLGRDVALDAFGQLSAVDIGVGFAQLHRDTALVDDAAVLLLDLEEHGGIHVGNAVGAQPQLFFICGLQQRGLDQLVVGVVEIDIADLGLAVAVDLHVGGDCVDKIFVLFAREHVFFLDAAEDVSESHGVCSFRVVFL